MDLSEAIMKSVGIMTYHYYNNHGTVLQAMALQQAIEGLAGYHCEIIDYRTADPDIISAFSGISYNQEPLIESGEYLSAYERYKDELSRRAQMFGTFQKKYLKCSEKEYDRNSLMQSPPQYDIYVSGGDQIWNTINRRYMQNAPYMLHFTHSKNKIAYGCGMCKYALYPYIVDFQYMPLLKEYRTIMVREESGYHSLSRYLDNVDGLVLDTSLLLETSHYDGMLEPPDADMLGRSIDLSSPFIFVYNLDRHESKFFEALAEMSKKLKRRVFVVSSDIPPDTVDGNITILLAIGPAQWLWLIKNADLVLTNSFHGIIFSILYRKWFAAVKPDARKITLLKMLGFTGKRIFDTFEQVPTDGLSSVEYDIIGNVLDQERDRCMQLLSSALRMCNE
jgi:hypothetical protein